MLDIVEKTTDELRNNEDQNSKVTYTTYVKVNDANELCTVFNAEQLLKDIGWTHDGEDELNRYIDAPVESQKLILAAEDSLVARELLIKFFKKIKANFEVFTNGNQLIQRIQEIEPEKVGMVLTDIEMPESDGFQVATFVKSNSRYKDIPVVINSSMTTDAVRNKMKSIGVDAFVGKTNVQQMYQTTMKFMG